MIPEQALALADRLLLQHQGIPLTDIQRLILQQSLAGKSYEQMEGYSAQHFRNEGTALWRLLSEVLGEKVSKTNFRGALEKRLGAVQTTISPPRPLVYHPDTWVGRDELISELTIRLQDQTRLLWLTGISGIGKTMLAECLAVRTWANADSFEWISFEILLGQGREFTIGAARILEKLGEADLDPQERNDAKHLTERLLHKFQSYPYWLQLDSLERLIVPTNPTKFADEHWLTFFQRCLMEQSMSRIVVTSQILPSAMLEWRDRYPNCWQALTLIGLSSQERDDRDTEQLALFRRSGINTAVGTQADILRRLGETYEGHPLVLRVIAGEIIQNFAGDVNRYWQVNQSEIEQVARELQGQRLAETFYNRELETRVRERVRKSLQQLPEDGFSLLCRCAVYCRPVPKSFWLALLDPLSPRQQKLAYQSLLDRVLVEQEGFLQDQPAVRLHNLIRDVAYDCLREDCSVWQVMERQAAQLWLNAYEPEPDAPNLEHLRGYLEAFDHYCEIKDWEMASELFMKDLHPPNNDKLYWLLFSQGYYTEQLKLCCQLCEHATCEVQIACYQGLGIAYACLANYPKSIAAYQQSLKVAIKIGDRRGEGNALGNMGLAYDDLGEYQKALDCHEQNLEISREMGDRKSESHALGNIGLTYNNLGEHRQAIYCHQQALLISREIGDRRGEGCDLGNMGIAYKDLGEYQKAIDCHEQDLEIAREIGNRQGEGNALGNMGIAYQSLGKYRQAIYFYEQQLEIMQEIGDRFGEGAALCNTGDTQIKLGEYDQALKNLQVALTIFQAIQSSNPEAGALKSLAELHYQTGQLDQATTYCHQALTIATRLAIPLSQECQELLQTIEVAKENREEPDAQKD
jgi:tetratricopeptide (TPR) repeat protein